MNYSEGHESDVASVTRVRAEFEVECVGKDFNSDEGEFALSGVADVEEATTLIEEREVLVTTSLGLDWHYCCFVRVFHALFIREVGTFTPDLSDDG